MLKLSIRRRFDWAVLPEKQNLRQPRTTSWDEVGCLFRWHSEGRRETDCLPRNLGLSCGLHIVSPVDVNFSPLDEVQFNCADDELPQAIEEFGIKEYWDRGPSRLGFRRSTGFKAFDFRVGDHWESMFIPNGQGTFEWRLGFDIFCNEGSGLLVAPAEGACGASALYGFIGPNSLRRMNSVSGFSIAMRCDMPVGIRRGQRIARVMAVPLSLLKCEVEIIQD